MSSDPAIDQHSAAVKKCEGSIQTGIRVCRAQSVVSGSTLRIGLRHFSQSVFLHGKWPARNLSKKKQWKTPWLQFAQPRRPASSYQQGTSLRWNWRLAFETSRTKASEDRERLNSYMTGKLSIRKIVRAVARVMPYGKGKDVILTIPDCDFQVDKRSTISDPEFRGPVGELQRARRSRSVAPGYACGR